MLTDKLTELALLRDETNKLSAERVEAKATVLASPESQNVNRLNALLEELEIKMHTLTTEIKKTAVKEAMTPENLPEEIKLKRFSEVYIKDENAAKKWIVENAPSLISYSYAKVKRAIENLELSWAEPYTDIRAEISSNLQKYLR